ncbi:MAG: hypothetical protein K5648_04350 [Erysipelotrichaceae bacterium]|nr:hypothetical protein [Erysipelotrichaceae bacterium]
MTMVNMLEAKTSLTKLVKLLENREEDEILICRNGAPVARIVKYEREKNKRIGIAKGYFGSLDLDEFNAMNEEIANEFYGE